MSSSLDLRRILQRSVHDARTRLVETAEDDAQRALIERADVIDSLLKTWGSLDERNRLALVSDAVQLNDEVSHRRRVPGGQGSK
jgi:hypothetical protein